MEATIADLDELYAAERFPPPALIFGATLDCESMRLYQQWLGQYEQLRSNFDLIVQQSRRLEASDAWARVLTTHDARYAYLDTPAVVEYTETCVEPAAADAPRPIPGRQEYCEESRHIAATDRALKEAEESAQREYRAFAEESINANSELLAIIGNGSLPFGVLQSATFDDYEAAYDTAEKGIRARAENAELMQSMITDSYRDNPALIGTCR